jgi:hypothetical protein
MADFPHPDLPHDPPPAVLDAVGAAWDRAAEFMADGLELHVSTGRISGRVRGRLCLEDQLLMRLSASDLLDLACGDLRPFGPRD